MNCEILELSDIAEVFNGKTPSTGDQRGSGFPVLKIRDVDDTGTFVGRFASFVEPAFAAKHPTKQIKLGDTLILNAAHNADYVGSKTFFASGLTHGALATGEWLVIRPDGKAANPKYVFYWSRTTKSRQRIRDAVKGIHLYPKDVAAFPIQLPTLLEQKRIAAILGKADRLRRTRRYARQLSDTFLQSVFLEMFGDPVRNVKGWPRESLAELGRIVTGSTPPSANVGMFGGGVPFVTPGDLEVDTLKTNRFLTDAGTKHSRLVRKGSTLVCCIGATIGKTDQAQSLSAFNQQINAVDWKPDIADSYGLFLMKFFSKEVAARGRSTTLPILKKSAFEEIAVPVPPPPLQQKFADIVRRFERLRAQQREAERQAEHLFQTLLHRAFSASL